MFDSDLTQNFNHQDATMEILIMLAGAFLLGCLLCWLLKKAFSKSSDSSKSELKQNKLSAQNNSSIKESPQTATSTPKVRIIENPEDSNYRTPRIDDLTKISGINSEIQKKLKNKGINTYIDLRDIDHEILKDTLDFSKKSSNLKEIETWPHQASLAAKGEWTKLYDYQSFIQRAKVASQNVQLTNNKDSSDDLKKIEGIGPKIEKILNNKGIYTFKELRETESDTLKSHIVNDDSRFEKNDTDSWPHQAGMAEKGQWEELSIYQEFMDISDNETDSSDIILDNNSQDDTDVILTKEEVNEVSSINKEYVKLLAEDDKEEPEKSTTDDLKKIEGIGPKIEELLNKNNIYSFEVLHKTERSLLKRYLDEAGPQFRMHEPASWPHQAGMAARGEWNGLKIYQDFMDGGRETPSLSGSSSNESNSGHIKIVKENNDQKDDLKKIEGIGPKIEELLNNADINTFKDLKKSNRNDLKKLLDKAGSQYRMHEPETWPLQANMAFKNEWVKLKEYQAFLLGG